MKLGARAAGLGPASRFGDRREARKRRREVGLRRCHRAEQITKQQTIASLRRRDPELRPGPRKMVPLVPLREGIEHAAHRGDRPLIVATADERDQALSEPGKIPVGDCRLVAVGVAALPVDRAEHGRAVVGVEKGAGTVIDRLARHGHVVGVHHPMHEPDVHPLREKGRLPLDDLLQKRECRIAGLCRLRHVPLDRMREQRRQHSGLGDSGRVLECAHANVARGHPRQDGPGQGRFPHHPLSRRRHGEAAGGRDAECVHGLADHILPEHRPLCRPAVAAAGVAGSPRALQLDVEPPAIGRELLAEQDRPAVTEVRELSELMAGVGLGDWLGSWRQFVATEDRSGVPQRRGVESEFLGQRFIEHEQRQALHRSRNRRRKQQGRQPGIRVVEMPVRGGGERCHARCSRDWQPNVSRIRSAACHREHSSRTHGPHASGS